MAVDLQKLIDIDLLSYFKTKLDLLFASKVDKVDGKGLSDTNFTQEEKTKLANIATGAEVNVNADWNATTGDAAILNKPENLVQDANYTHTDNNYTTEEKQKLSGIAAGANKTTVDATFSTTSTNPVQNKVINAALNNKVDKVDGKGLSTEDFTTTEKNKLSGISEGAKDNVIETIQKNGTELTVTDKTVNITVPTKTSDLTNDSGYITGADVPEGAAASTTTPKMDGTAAVGTEMAFARGDHVHPTDTSRAPITSPDFKGTPKAPTAAAGTSTTQIATTAFVAAAVSGKANSATTLSGYGITDAYTKTEIDNKISAAMNYKGTKATVSALPSSGNTTGDVWHVTETGGEYAWNGTSWEELGSTIDLSGYVEESEISLATTDDIDALFE